MDKGVVVKNILVVIFFNFIFTQSHAFDPAFAFWQMDSNQLKVQASDKGSNHFFGNAVAISGDGQTAAVGAEDAGTGGQVYIYSQVSGAWTEQAILVSCDIDLSIIHI